MKNLPFRLIFAILAAVLVLTSCGSDAADETETTTDSTESAVDESTDSSADNADDDVSGDSSSDEAEDTTETTATEATDGESLQVEVNLIDELDGLINGYCLDIAGGNESVDPANGLQVHTCYSYQGDLGTDQIFDTASFSGDTLYMPVYDVCAQVDSATAGSAVSLGTCDGSDSQSLVFGDDGAIRPMADASLCFTAGSESRTGRSGDHQIRDLTLEACSDDLAPLQQWAFRTGL